jgi:site-specific DNA-adenine methylase
MLKLVNYPGSKARVLSQLYPLLDLSREVYVEPFLGGGVVLLNMPAEAKFSRIYASDQCPHVVNALVNLRRPVQLIQHATQVSQLGLKKNREAYYQLRERWNLRSCKVTPQASAEFILLANSCINGLVRFGPRGFNQAWGAREMNLDSLYQVAAWINARELELSVMDFREAFLARKNVWHQATIYADPPYSNCVGPTVNGIYDNCRPWLAKDDADLADLCLQAVQAGAHVVVSSLADNHGLNSRLIGFKEWPCQRVYKASPGRHLAKGHVEIILVGKA